MLAALSAFTSSILMPIRKRFPRLAFGPMKAIIRLELFADLLCPVCASIWLTVQSVLNHYPTQLNLDGHFFPFPYQT
jgi:hypothetical protein